MMKNEILNTSLEAVGKNIGQELGAKMVKDFQDNYPSENPWLFVGKNIIDQILNQPGCVGIRFYNALDEVGQKTLVYVGIDTDDNIISEYTQVDTNGQLNNYQGIVADRASRPGTGTGKDTASTSTSTFDWWSAI